MNALLLTLAHFLTILSGLLDIHQAPSTNPISVSSLATSIITISGVNVIVEIADTDAARAQGLSDRPALEKNQGMLFVFERADKHSFWMKDMRFPLDVIWFNDNWQVIDLTENISPPPTAEQAKNFLTIYQPRAPARYVLEVNAGFIARHDISMGVQVILPLGGLGEKAGIL